MSNDTKNTVETLREFVDAATRSRKYPENTAGALKTALRLFENELNEEEKSSIKTFQDNLDRIYQAVFEKNKTKYTAGSLDVYRKRVSKLLNNYLAYGTDAAKMNSWSPAVRKPTVHKKPSASIKNPEPDSEDSDNRINELPQSGTRVEWPFAENRKVVLTLPPDLTTQEAETIKSLVDLRIAKNNEDEK